MSRRFCFAPDLKDDPALIADYWKYHENIWPEITRSLEGLRYRRSGDLPVGTCMFMIMEVNQSFSFEKESQGR
jgi:L-rhamnose mutarotase